MLDRTEAAAAKPSRGRHEQAVASELRERDLTRDQMRALKNKQATVYPSFDGSYGRARGWRVLRILGPDEAIVSVETGSANPEGRVGFPVAAYYALLRGVPTRGWARGTHVIPKAAHDFIFCVGQKRDVLHMEQGLPSSYEIIEAMSLGELQRLVISAKPFAATRPASLSPREAAATRPALGTP